ncbi:DUF6090 family protein [Roseivirga sp. BDSF3-8]|uniref:DUF6090 family protein n=1 Tax=Roseivirga sp. BDSF3-8 TaxID=3241598 RepID=UPI00353224A3
MAENNFTRYLLYAVGEVFLIVVGILIALAINNWNQREAAKKREQFYLEGLKAEFQQSRAKLVELMRVNRLNYEEAKRLAQIINSDSADITESALSDILLNTLSYEISYNPNNSLLLEIINSGGLKDLSDAELRMYLTSWESVIRQVHQQEASLRTQREYILGIFREGEGSIRTVVDKTGISVSQLGLEPKAHNESNLGIIRTSRFEDNLLMFILIGITTEDSHYLPLQDRIDTVLALIDHNLDK